ncbi:MAG: hypothetical protein RL748_3930 [Pseudomonadota bacterium]|jgi:hypothetical protein
MSALIATAPRLPSTRADVSKPTDSSVKIDIARLTPSLASETITAPSGLSSEAKRQFILQHAK